MQQVTDLGGRLPYRLTLRGHRVVVVERADDTLDGRGMPAWLVAADSLPFATLWARIDRLPLADACAELVVFNASLHASTDIGLTLAEALRVLRPDGRVAALIPPACDLTAECLDEVGAGLGLAWQARRRALWAFRPGAGRARGDPDASRCRLVVGTRLPRGPHELLTPRRRMGALSAAWRTLLRLRYELFERQRRHRPVRELVAGRTLLVQPGVFNPRLFRTGEYLARFVARGVVTRGTTVLDMGTGSGAAALAAAGNASRVVAVDVNPAAVECAAANARLNGLTHRVEVRRGDLFGALRREERFDLVLFNPPFYRGRPRDDGDAAWRSVDVPERFAQGLAGHLTPRGRALVVLSSDCDVDGWLRPCRESGLDVRPVARRDLINEVLVLYRIARPPSGRSQGEA